MAVCKGCDNEVDVTASPRAKDMLPLGTWRFPMDGLDVIKSRLL